MSSPSTSAIVKATMRKKGASRPRGLRSPSASEFVNNIFWILWPLINTLCYLTGSLVTSGILRLGQHTKAASKFLIMTFQTMLKQTSNKSSMWQDVYPQHGLITFVIHLLFYLSIDPYIHVTDIRGVPCLVPFCDSRISCLCSGGVRPLSHIVQWRWLRFRWHFRDLCWDDHCIFCLATLAMDAKIQGKVVWSWFCGQCVWSSFSFRGLS